jgi:transcriptional antiterminator RfaH
MPLLPLGTFVSPDNLFLDSDPPPAQESCWWALHTRPRAEKVLAERLLRRGLSFFLPLYQRQWRNRGRLLSAHLPLFPGYLFLHGDADARLRALETNLVARVLPVVAQAQLHSDLRRVYQLVTTGMSLTPEERLQPGMNVEIIAGPLAGLHGKVLRRNKQLRFFVEVHLLQRGVSVEIEGWMLEPLPGPRITAREAASCR